MSDFALRFIPVEGEAEQAQAVPSFANRFIPEPEIQEVEDERSLLQRAADALGYTDDVYQNRTAVLEQIPAGMNEGAAWLAGTPVDLTTMAVNAGASGINKLAGTEIPQIENPVGGSGTFEAAVKPFITAPDPQTAGQRYARRGGQEVGYGLPISAITGGGRALVMAMNTAADIAAGIAGQTAREIAPENNMLDAIVSILAGTGTAAKLAKPKKPPAPYKDTQAMFDASDRARTRVQDSGVNLSRPAQEELFDRMYARLKSDKFGPRNFPKAYGEIEDAREWPMGTIADVEDTRRAAGRNVAKDINESAAGMALKDEIDQYLKSLDPSKTVGGTDPEKAISDLLESRNIYHQAKKAEAVEGQAYRAKSRAARSGRGGNEINTMRQNVGKILDNEVAPTKAGKRSGYTPDEIAQMEEINFGTRGQNIGRHIAGWAPTTGVLPAMSGGAGYGAAAIGTAMGQPLAALAAIPPSMGFIAKGLTERSTRKQIDELLDIIRRGGTAATKKMSPSARQALIAQMLSSADTMQPQ